MFDFGLHFLVFKKFQFLVPKPGYFFSLAFSVEISIKWGSSNVASVLSKCYLALERGGNNQTPLF